MNYEFHKGKYKQISGKRFTLYYSNILTKTEAKKRADFLRHRKYPTRGGTFDLVRIIKNKNKYSIYVRCGKC